MVSNDFELYREQIWLVALEKSNGALNQAQLAAMVGLSPGQVSRRIARAKRLRVTPSELHQMELVESVNPFRTHGCEMHHVIRAGDLKVCLACGKSGMDHASPFNSTQPLAADVKLPGTDGLMGGRGKSNSGLH